MNKTKFKIVEEGSQKFVLASDVPGYAKVCLGTSFDIPSYRTLRYYATNKVIERPHRLAKEVYFDVNYIINAVDLLRRLRQFNPSLSQLQKIVPNVSRSREWKTAFEILDIDKLRFTDKGEFLELLGSEKPTEIIKGLKGTGKSHIIKKIS